MKTSTTKPSKGAIVAATRSKTPATKPNLVKTALVKSELANAQPVLGELRGLIEQARQQAATAVNSALTLLYWQVGKRLCSETLQNERARYGAEILATVSQELVRDYGKGFTVSALTRMMKFSEAFPSFEIVATLSRQLSWSHFVEILPLKQPLEREFYAEMCRIERWSVRTDAARRYFPIIAKEAA